MTVLQIIGAACDEMGLDRPQTIVSNQNQQTRQLFALFKRLCDDMCKQHDWQELVNDANLFAESYTRSGSVTQGGNVITLADTSGITTDFVVEAEGLPKGLVVLSVIGNQVTINAPALASHTGAFVFSRYRFDLPADYLRMIANTPWDTSNDTRMYGSVTPQGWQTLKHSTINLGIYLRFRIRHGKIELVPAPADNRTIAYSYISGNFAVKNNGERTNVITADDDDILFDKSLMILGVTYLFKQANGIDSTTELGAFRLLLNKLIAQDSPAPIISTSGNWNIGFINGKNVLDGNWNV